MKKYERRSKEIDNHCKVLCPKHNLRPTFILFRKEKETSYNKKPYGNWEKGYLLVGIGCDKCFNKLKII